jgi:hypothetical protein
LAINVVKMKKMRWMTKTMKVVVATKSPSPHSSPAVLTIKVILACLINVLRPRVDLPAYNVTLLTTAPLVNLALPLPLDIPLAGLITVFILTREVPVAMHVRLMAVIVVALVVLPVITCLQVVLPVK